MAETFQKPSLPSPADESPSSGAGERDGAPVRPPRPEPRGPAVPGVGVDLPPSEETPAIAEEALGRVRITAWRDGESREYVGIADMAALVEQTGIRLWVDVDDPSPRLVALIADLLRLHPLVAEDIVERNQRSKVELTGDVLHIVVFAMEYEREVLLSEIDCVLGASFLLTVHDHGWQPRSTLHLRSGPGPLLARGPDYLLWGLVDAMVDGYFPVFDRLGDEIDDVQDELIDAPTRASLDRLFYLKKELIRIRHIVGPNREIFNQLTNREIGVIQPEQILYFRDVYDHLIRLNDELDSFRELVSGALDVYLTTVNNNLSLIMKRLTGVTVILAGIAAVSGLFGMSEAATAISGAEGAGFWVVVAVTVGLAALAAIFLRRINWL